MKRLLVFMMLFLLPVTALATEVSPEPTESETVEIAATSDNALVYDTVSGQLLFEKNIHERVPIASITKIMTTLLVIEHGEFDEMVTAGEDIYFDIASDGKTQNIVTGEIMSVMDLLYCVMVDSANEACNILAEYVAGSVEEFVALMNARAAELGCKDTNFANTHGMPDDNHYSSAYDVMLITKEAMRYPIFMELANTTAKTIGATNMKQQERSLFTTNHLISKRKQDGYLYHLAQGIKTGHTSLAGYCLVSSASSEGMSIITVVLGADLVDDWIMSFIETKELMEWCFSSFSYRQILDTKEIIGKVEVTLGKDYREVTVAPQKSVTSLIPKDLATEDIERKITLAESVEAPVNKGQQLGEITLSYNGSVYGIIPLVSVIGVERSQEESLVQDVQQFVAKPWLRYAVLTTLAIIVIYIIVVIAYNSRRRTMSSNYKGKKRRRW